MKTVSFSKLSNTKNRANLGAVLKVRTNGALSDKHVGQILTRLDISLQYRVIVTSDPAEYAKLITLKDHYSQNSSGYYNYAKQTARPLLADLYGEYGLNLEHEIEEYHDRRFSKEHTVPDFDVDKIQCDLIITETGANCNDTTTYTHNEICVYIPSDSPMLDAETLELCKRFGLA